MSRTIERGEVVWVNLDPTVGGEIRKARPCIVASINLLNDSRLTVVVVPLSSSGSPRPPLVIPIPSVGGRSNARIDQLRAVDKSRIGERLGQVTAKEMREVEAGLRVVLGL